MSLRTELFVDIHCTGNTSTYDSPPDIHTASYTLATSGRDSVQYSIRIVLSRTQILLEEGQGSVEVSIPANEMVVRSFDLVDMFTDDETSYVQVEVSSLDKFLNKSKNGSNDDRYEAVLMVTTDPSDLFAFFSQTDMDRRDSVHLSFSTFGMITLSGMPSFN